MGCCGRELLQFSDQLLVFAGTRFSEASYQLGSRQIVDGLNLDDGSLTRVFANRRGQPLKPFLISPDLNPLARPFGRQSKSQQQPRRAVLSPTYSHFI